MNTTNLQERRKASLKSLCRKDRIARKGMTKEDVRQALRQGINGAIELQKEITMVLIAQVTNKFPMHGGQTLENMDPDLDQRLDELQGQFFTRGCDYMDTTPHLARWEFEELFCQFVAIYLPLFVVNITIHEKVKSTIGTHTLRSTLSLQSYFKLKNETQLLDIDNWLEFCFGLEGVILDKAKAGNPLDDRLLDLLFPRYAKYLRKKLDSKNKAESHLVTFPKIEGLGWHEVSITFVQEDTFRVDARGTNLVFLCENVGFGDTRTGKPSQPWFLLKIMAKEGTLPQAREPKVKKTLSVLRKKLRTMMNIEADPFYPYSKFRCYKPKFKLSDNTVGHTTAEQKIDNFYSREKYEDEARIPPQYKRRNISEDPEYKD